MRTDLHFDRDMDQWCIQLRDRSYPLHCGESFILYVGKTAYPCRLELDSNWYIIMPDTKFVLHTSTVYTVNI